MSISNTISNDSSRLSSSQAVLEAQLEDTIELLHLWKNEAYAYRSLVEAILTGRYTHEEARLVLAKNYCLKYSDRKDVTLAPSIEEESLG